MEKTVLSATLLVLSCLGASSVHAAHSGDRWRQQINDYFLSLNPESDSDVSSGNTDLTYDNLQSVQDELSEEDYFDKARTFICGWKLNGGKAYCTLFSVEEMAKKRYQMQEMTSDSLSAPLNVTIKELKVNSAVVMWDIFEGDPVIGFAITQQKKDVHMLRFIQEVNTTTRSCALWELEEDTDYIVHVQSISLSGTSPPSEPVRFRTPKEAEKLASNSPDEVTIQQVGQSAQLRAGELIIIVVVLIMWAGVIALFCRQYDIIKDNEPNNNKDKAKNSSECSTPEHPTGGLLRSKV